MSTKHIHVVKRGPGDDTVVSELDVDAETPKVSSIDFIRGRLGRQIWKVTWEDVESGTTVTIEVKQLRPGEIALLSDDRIPVLRKHYPELMERIEAAPLPPDATPGRGEFWQKAQPILTDKAGEDFSEWENTGFMFRYMAEIVAEAVVDKRIDFELIVEFPHSLLHRLYEVATGSLDESTVDTFPEVGEEDGESE